MLDRTTETFCIVRKREKSFLNERATAYSDRKRPISVLQSAISCVIDLHANVKPRRPFIFISLHEVSWRRLNELVSLDIENDLGIKTHCVKAVLRPASTSSRGWGSSDKNSNSRRTREARSSRSALFRLVVWNAIRRNAAKQSKRPYVDYLNDVEQTVDSSFERGSCYWYRPSDSLNHRKYDLDGIGSSGKSRIGWICSWRTWMGCRARSFTRTLLANANCEYPASGESYLRDRGHDYK
jgi:hypothetical protein